MNVTRQTLHEQGAILRSLNERTQSACFGKTLEAICQFRTVRTGVGDLRDQQRKTARRRGGTGRSARRWLSGRRPLGDALAALQANRDLRAKPMYDFTCQMATLEPPPPLMQRLFLALHGNQEATNQFYSM
jgi:hypothetical protein